MPAKKRYYSAKDIKEMLSVSENTAYKLMHMFEQRGECLRVGKSMRVEVNRFEQWLERNTVRR